MNIMHLDGDISERFEMLILETAQEYIDRKEKEKREKEAKWEARKKEIEKEQKGLCDCGNERPRWVRDEFYICYECFMHGLSCEACEGSYPTRSVASMEDYMDEAIWNDEWEEENIVDNNKEL